MDVLNSFGENIWWIDGDPVHMLTIPFTTRMTVVRLADGSLWLHSPVAATPERLDAISGLGPVGHLVAPNKFHHLFVAEWSRAYPEAKTWAGPELAVRRKDLRFDGQLGDTPEPAWAGDLDQSIFRGSNILPEVVFCHRPSRALVLTDLIQNHEPELDGWFWRNVKRINGILAPEGGVPRDLRLTIRDKEAARRSLDRLLAWDFDKIIISHGLCIDQDGRRRVEDAFQWLGR